MAYKRRPMTRKQNRKNFKRGTRVNRKNGRGRPMRGGIRL